MDGNRFDALSRTLATRMSRRTAFTGAVAAVLGAVGVRQPAGAQVSQAQCGNKFCASDPAVCAAGCVCCVYPNGNSRCRPPGTCSPGQTVCPPGQILSSSGVCVAPTTTTTTTTTTTAAPTNLPIGSQCESGSQCREHHCCDGFCKDLTRDEDHCGACDAACPAITGVDCFLSECCQVNIKAGGATCGAELGCCFGRICQSGGCCEPEGEFCLSGQCCDGLVCSGSRCVAAS